MYEQTHGTVFVPFLGDFFSITMTNCIYPRKRRFRPLSRGLFFNFPSSLHRGTTLATSFRPLSRGLFFNTLKSCHRHINIIVFVPFLGDFFSMTVEIVVWSDNSEFSSPFSGTFFQSFIACRLAKSEKEVFVPFLGDFFSIACLQSPSPSALASAFAAGMGDRFIRHSPSEMKCRFSQAGRASAGICNEKIEMRNGGAAHKNMEPPRRFETSDFFVSQT